MKTVANAVSLRVREILKQKNMSIYRLEKITAMPHNSMQTVMRADNNSVNLKTVLLLIKGLEITAKEFFDSPLFEDDELDID
ncbi:MAG: hypothetical protein ACI4NG_01810 [Candidatus Gallimonas sp.]